MINKKVIVPALVSFALCIVINIVLAKGSFDIGANIVAALIMEAFAYITCRYIVLRKSMREAFVWLNYAIWLFLMTFGKIVEFLK